MSDNISNESEGLGRTEAGVPNGPESIAPTPGASDEAARLVDGSTPSGDAFVADFVVTKKDLRHLARAYHTSVAEVDWFCEFYGCGMSGSWHGEQMYASERLDAIRRSLGAEESDHIRDEAADKRNRKWEKGKRNLVCRVCNVAQDTFEDITDGVCEVCRARIEGREVPDQLESIDGKPRTSDSSPS